MTKLSLENTEYTKSSKPLKYSKVGMEIETHIIDENGSVSDRSEEIIKKVKEVDEKIPIIKECGKNMLEFGCYPSDELAIPALDLVYSLETTFEIAKKMNLTMFPFATYPGKFKPIQSSGPGYKLKKKIFGEEKFEYAMKCTGFHNHYSLPKGVFDYKKLHLKELKNSKLSRNMISAYNFEIAIDPILTLFAQSSPFIDGNYLAKDSRMLVYRGGRKLKYDGLYAKHQQIGGLPPYKQTVTDLMHSQLLRVKTWKKLIKKSYPNVKFEELYESPLDVGWNPVKINPHGTIEQRGMDMNFISTLVAVSVLIKSYMRKIQEEFIEVLPADFGMEEPFKFEKGILYIPPHSYVRNQLQNFSAYKGFSSKELYEYASKFFKLGKEIAEKEELILLNPIKDMLDTKDSMSDKIVNYAKSKGYYNEGKINNKDAAEMALYYSDKFYEDFLQIKQHIVDLKGL